MDTPSSATAPSGENALESAFSQNERWAFEAAYAAYRRTMFGAAFGVLGDAQSAEDCVHDVLLRLWRSENAYRPARGRLEAFLAVCVRNEALARRRNEANRLRIVAAGSGEHRPHDDVAHLAQSVDVREAIARLNQAQQRVLAMAYFEGLPYEEIARQCGEPAGTIKSRLSNALKALRRQLSPEEPA